MRPLSLPILLTCCTLSSAVLFSAFASAETSKPPKAKATDPAAPPIVEQFDPSLEPQVVIRSTDRGVETEYRLRGRLYMIRVQPEGGAEPYYLVDQHGDGKFIPAGQLGNPMTPPMWLIGTF